MIQGKQICPAGGSREISGNPASAGKTPDWLLILRNLFHTAPAAISGNSGKVMDNCIEYHREHRGE